MEDEYRWCCRSCGNVFNDSQMKTKYHQYGKVKLGQKCCPKCRSSDITCISLQFRPVETEEIDYPVLTSFGESEDDDADFFSQFWESGVVTDQDE